jgi:hypothetical protein
VVVTVDVDSVSEVVLNVLVEAPVLVVKVVVVTVEVVNVVVVTRLVFSTILVSELVTIVVVELCIVNVVVIVAELVEVIVLVEYSALTGDIKQAATHKDTTTIKNTIMLRLILFLHLSIPPLTLLTPRDKSTQRKLLSRRDAKEFQRSDIVRKLGRCSKYEEFQEPK